MSQYHQLKARLNQTPYIVADAVSGKIQLADGANALATISAEDPFPTHAVVDLASALEAFAKLQGVGKADREFNLPEIAKIVGVSYHLSYNYVQRGILVPSIRPSRGSGKGSVEARFSWADAFVAGVVGCLRRHGIPIKALKQVHSLFRDSQKKQTAQKLKSSKRS